jgi:hypothetical protein
VSWVHGGDGGAAVAVVSCLSLGCGCRRVMLVDSSGGPSSHMHHLDREVVRR